MKVAYNGCFGGFGLSHTAVLRYAELKGITIYSFVDNRGKTKFVRPDGSVGGSPGHGIVLVAMGATGCKAVSASGLGMYWNVPSDRGSEQ